MNARQRDLVVEYERMYRALGGYVSPTLTVDVGAGLGPGGIGVRIDPEEIRLRSGLILAELELESEIRETGPIRDPSGVWQIGRNGRLVRRRDKVPVSVVGASACGEW